MDGGQVGRAAAEGLHQSILQTAITRGKNSGG